MKYLAMVGIYAGLLGAKYALARRYPDGSHEVPILVVTLSVISFVGAIVWLSFA